MNTNMQAIRLVVGFSLLLPIAAQSDEFSIAIIPDTQMYVEQHPEVFEAQVDWIVANEVAEDIIYVAHLGDLKDDLSCDNKTVNLGTGGGRSEWQIVDDALGDLDAASIPYGVVPGNHDFDQVGGDCPNFTTERPLGTYNALLGPLRFAGTPYYGDPSVPTPGNRVVNSNEDSFTLFEGACGVKFIAINLAYKQGANQVGMDPELVWANNLLSTYSDRLGIITSHYFMDANPGNSLGPYGQEVYDGLSGNSNMLMMLSAHEFGEAWLVETTGRGGMQPVQILLADYQRDVFPFADGDMGTPPNDPNPAGIDFTDLDQTSFGDSGFMRIMRFDTDTSMVNIETFIPPVIPIKNRPGTLVSTYFPANGNGMNEGTASNLSFSFAGYGSDPSCPSIGTDILIATSANEVLNPSSIFSVDTVTGVATLIGAPANTPNGISDITVNPVDGRVYALHGGSAKGAELIELDPQTAAVLSRVAITTSVADFRGSGALAFDDTGTLYVGAWAQGRLMVVNPATGVASSDIPLTGGGGNEHIADLAWDRTTGELWASRGGSAGAVVDIQRIDPSTGAVSQTIALGGTTKVTAIAIDENGTMYASFDGNQLATVDRATGAVTLIGNGFGGRKISGLGFVPAP